MTRVSKLGRIKHFSPPAYKFQYLKEQGKLLKLLGTIWIGLSGLGDDVHKT